MSTLPINILALIDDLETPDAPEAATAILRNYFKAFSAESASVDLWSLIVLMLTAPEAPNINNPEERQDWLHFYDPQKGC